MSEDFRRRIERFVRTETNDYRPTADGTKIIHDPIWGSVEFHPWEVRLIDSPLFQRLRGISQVGLAESTYPAARHTRFDHSLGTAAVASRMAQRLYSDAKRRPEVCSVIDEEKIHLLRLAALLHDVGHCPYSHLSESIYGNLPEFDELRRAILEETDLKTAPSPHEIFSYFIIVSDAFASFFHEKIRYPGIRTLAEAKVCLKQAANLVVGAVNRDENGAKLSYLTHILNGTFDADKLDYTQRDSYTAGIALTYGVERFLLKLVLCKTEENGETDYRLGITADALSTVEELIFNRSMLYHYMYRHQKVLAAEAQMRDALYALVRVGKIKHPCDFLFFTNQDLGLLYRSDRQPFAEDRAKGKTLKTMYTAFGCRTLLKRAFELGPDGFSEFRDGTVSEQEALRELRHAENTEEAEKILQDLLAEASNKDPFPPGIAAYVEYLRNCTAEESIAERKTIARRIAEAYEKIGKPVDFDAFDLALSFQPALKSNLSITITDKEHRPVNAEKSVGRIRDWSNAFNRGKWRGYLFVAPHVDRKIAGEIFREYLKEWCTGKQLPLYTNDEKGNIIY